MQETQVRFLGGEDPLEKETATHSSIFAWRIPWTEEPGRLQSMGSQESDTTKRLSTAHTVLEFNSLHNASHAPNDISQIHKCVIFSIFISVL